MKEGKTSRSKKGVFIPFQTDADSGYWKRDQVFFDGDGQVMTWASATGGRGGGVQRPVCHADKRKSPKELTGGRGSDS